MTATPKRTWTKAWAVALAVAIAFVAADWWIFMPAANAFDCTPCSTGQTLLGYALVAGAATVLILLLVGLARLVRGDR